MFEINIKGSYNNINSVIDSSNSQIFYSKSSLKNPVSDLIDLYYDYNNVETWGYSLTELFNTDSNNTIDNPNAYNLVNEYIYEGSIVYQKSLLSSYTNKELLYSEFLPTNKTEGTTTNLRLEYLNDSIINNSINNLSNTFNIDLSLGLLLANNILNSKIPGLFKNMTSDISVNKNLLILDGYTGDFPVSILGYIFSRSGYNVYDPFLQENNNTAIFYDISFLNEVTNNIKSMIKMLLEKNSDLTILGHSFSAYVCACALTQLDDENIDTSKIKVLIYDAYMGNIINNFTDKINKTKAKAIYTLSSSAYRVEYVKDNKVNSVLDFNNVYENYNVIVRNNSRPSFHGEYSNLLVLLGDNVSDSVKTALLNNDLYYTDTIKNDFDNYNIKTRLTIKEMIDLVNKLENNELNGTTFGNDFYNYKFIN